MVKHVSSYTREPLTQRERPLYTWRPRLTPGIGDGHDGETSSLLGRRSTPPIWRAGDLAPNAYSNASVGYKRILDSPHLGMSATIVCDGAHFPPSPSLLTTPPTFFPGLFSLQTSLFLLSTDKLPHQNRHNESSFPQKIVRTVIFRLANLASAAC